MYKENDVVLSSRVRLARNLKDYAYASHLDTECAKEIIERIGNALGDEYTRVFNDELSAMEQMSYVEKHYVSREFVHSALPHQLFVKGDIRLMACEEDHIRLQAIKKGLALDECYNEAHECDELLCSRLDIDHSDTLGYLTHCPTNLGTGMRASVLVFLPGLVMTNRLKGILSSSDKLGLSFRGMYGEGSESDAYLFQISNRESFGISEQGILIKLKNILSQIIDYERKAREEIKRGMGIELSDKLSRALGVMKYAKKITSKEFSELYARVRLGICLGFIEDIELEVLDKLYTEVMPYTLCVNMNKRMNEGERDIARSEYIQKNL